MSATIDLHCDNCGDYIAPQGSTVAKARAAAANEDGWHSRTRRGATIDLCSRCRADELAEMLSAGMGPS